MQSRVGKIFVFSSFCISKCEGCQFVNPGLAGLSHFEPGDGGVWKYAILARRGNDILKLLRSVGLSKCTAFGHGVRTGSGFVEA